MPIIDILESIYSIASFIAAETLDSWILDAAGEAYYPSLDDIAVASELREAILGWIAAGPYPPPRSVETINRASRSLPARIVIDAGGATTLEPAARSPLEQALTRVLIAVYEIVAAGLWPRLKICANPDCGRVFFDRSKNRSGRWCEMASCGNRLKARRHRARKRTAGT
ncbi:MAG TPA: CGNR zinc finger domain-containing protein [bacterium]|nr:CGNR zinc finger domain-containing protein [bacterium]